MLLSIGQKAPGFSLLSSTGGTVRLSDFTGKNYLVLIFYPGDDTPGCTKQLCAVRDDYAKFEAKNAKVFGVNPAGEDSHRKFVAKFGFQFPLLIDEGQDAAKLYGCDNPPSVKRTVYVIDPQGTVVYVKQGMPSNEEILQAIPGIQPESKD
jgi:thioredoxin-dependent peroxiredoxin